MQSENITEEFQPEFVERSEDYDALLRQFKECRQRAQSAVGRPRTSADEL